MNIKHYQATSTNVQEIICRLDNALKERYTESDIHGIDGEEFEKSGGYFVICEEDGKAVGCGAFRPLDKSIAEVKRMFVEEKFRGRGYALAILLHLEEKMRTRKFETAVLETGIRQPEAIGLYKKLGYIPIPRFGSYVDCELSVCFAKKL